MKIIIEGRNLSKYLAKCHEALRTGLSTTFDARCFGVGYGGFNPRLEDFREIPNAVGMDNPDLIIIQGFKEDFSLNYRGLSDLPFLKSILLCDYWSEAESRLDRYIDAITVNKIDVIFSYFIQPVIKFKETPIGSKLVFLPPCFDPALFSSWGLQKVYDVGFLGDGTLSFHPVYPERHEIHKKLIQIRNFRYLYGEHPGWKEFDESHCLVGRGFSKAINSCKMFIVTTGILNTLNSKIIEVLASKSMLLSDAGSDSSCLGLKDGLNYVKISKDDVVDKIRFYLDNEQERERISMEGYNLAIGRHSCFSRARELRDGLIDGGFYLNRW